MIKIEKILLALFSSATLAMTINAYAEDSFAPCQRAGRIQECIAVPLAEKVDDSEAKKFQPPSDGKSRIYIVRPYTQEQKKKSSVFVDGKPVAEIAPMTYVVLDVMPGTHRITLNTNDNTEIQLDVAPGRLYYIQYHLTIWFNTVTGKVTLLNEKNGRSQVLRSKRVRRTNEILEK